jgi:hypothetical protein
LDDSREVVDFGSIDEGCQTTSEVGANDLGFGGNDERGINVITRFTEMWKIKILCNSSEVWHDFQVLVP